LKRFFTPLFVLSLGIFVSLTAMRTIENSHGSPFGRAVRFFQSWKEAAPIEGDRRDGKLSAG
jgi:hypothetical protein